MQGDTGDGGFGSAWANWRGALVGVRREAWGDLWGYVFIFPAVAMFVLFGSWPLLRGLSMAFTDYRYALPDYQPFVGFLNFAEMAGDERFWQAAVRSVLFSLYYVPPIILLPLGLAVLIARVRQPQWSAIYRVCAYLPVVLPISVAVLLFAELFHSQFGYINYFLDKILRLGVKPAWFGDPALILPSMAAASVWKHMGTNTLLLLVGLYNISGELYEAAAIDGANGWRQFRHITLPLLKPMLTVVVVLSVEVLAYSGTQEALVLFKGGGPEDAAQTVGVYAYQTAFKMGDLRWGYAAAMNLALGVAAMVLAGLMFRVLRTERHQ
jgi:multiple sugar transport system permease protein